MTSDGSYKKFKAMKQNCQFPEISFQVSIKYCTVIALQWQLSFVKHLTSSIFISLSVKQHRTELSSLISSKLSTTVPITSRKSDVKSIKLRKNCPRVILKLTAEYG